MRLLPLPRGVRRRAALEVFSERLDIDVAAADDDTDPPSARPENGARSIPPSSSLRAATPRD